jgi:hypothetical protein
MMLNTSKLLFKSHTAIGFNVKTMSAHGSHLGWRSWSPDTILKVYYPRTIHSSKMATISGHSFNIGSYGKYVYKFSPLKPVSKFKASMAWMVLKWSIFKIVFSDPDLGCRGNII